MCHAHLPPTIVHWKALKPGARATTLLSAIEDFRTTGAVSLEPQEIDTPPPATPESDLWSAMEAAEGLELEGFGELEEIELQAPAAEAEVDAHGVQADPAP